MEVAFGVREAHADGEFGAVAVADGEAYHVGEALAEGNGYVVVESDSLLWTRLCEQPGLEQVEVEVARRAQRKSAAAAKPAPKSGDNKDEG